MARIRSIKPQLFRHAELFDAEKVTGFPLRLTFIGLILCCDKEGRFDWRPRELKLDILPYDDELDFNEILNALVRYQFIVKYRINDSVYGTIPSWHKHQVINLREHRSLIPAYQPEFKCEIEDTISFDTSKPSKVKDAVMSTKAMSSSNNLAIEIFNYWKEIMGHTQAKFDKKREKMIKTALAQGYSKEQLFMAIQGCKLTPYHMGDNPQGQRYDSLKVILRDADQIDRFLRHCHSPPKPLNVSQRRTDANRKILQKWLDNNQSSTTTLNHNEVNHEES